MLGSSPMSTPDVTTLPAETLAQRPLVLVALEGSTILADRRFPPGATVSVGSNSRTELPLPPKFELAAYTLLTGGSVLHLAPPLHVQARVWHDGKVVELKGHFRDLRKKHPDLPDVLPLASERFVVSYATGVVFMGRFLPEDAA